MRRWYNNFSTCSFPTGTKYRLYQLHFHWGKKTLQGSEHQLDSQQYAGEVTFLYMLLSRELVRTWGSERVDFGHHFASSTVVCKISDWFKIESTNGHRIPESCRFFRFSFPPNIIHYSIIFTCFFLSPLDAHHPLQRQIRWRWCSNRQIRRSSCLGSLPSGNWISRSCPATLERPEY